MPSHEQNACTCHETVWNRLETAWQYDSMSLWWYSEERMNKGHPYACGRSDDAYAKHAIDVTLPHTVLRVVKALHFPWYWSKVIGNRMAHDRIFKEHVSLISFQVSTTHGPRLYRYGIILGQLLTSQPRSRCSHIHGWSQSWCQHSQSSPATFGDFFNTPDHPVDTDITVPAAAFISQSSESRLQSKRPFRIITAPFSTNSWQVFYWFLLRENLCVRKLFL